MLEPRWAKESGITIKTGSGQTRWERPLPVFRQLKFRLTYSFPGHPAPGQDRIQVLLESGH